nr:sugar phosphate isomerase/epimerase family protein [Maliibacterium massiliense]
MNKIGLNAIYWRGTGIENDLYEMMRRTALCDVDIYEVRASYVQDFTNQQCDDFRKALADIGLGLIFTGGLNAAQNIASDDENVRRNGVEYSKRLVEKMRRCGGRIWSGINYGQGQGKPDHVTDWAEKQRMVDVSVRSMREIMKTAEDEGLVYAFEVVNRFEQFLFNTAKEAVAYCEMVDSPNAQLLIDTFHMNIEEDSITEAIEYAHAKGRMAHFHVGESNRRVPGIGKGHIDWPSIFATLKKVGYQGAISIEPLVLMSTPDCFVWRDLASRKWEDLYADVRKGAAYLRANLAD